MSDIIEPYGIICDKCKRMVIFITREKTSRHVLNEGTNIHCGNPVRPMNHEELQIAYDSLPYHVKYHNASGSRPCISFS